MRSAAALGAHETPSVSLHQSKGLAYIHCQRPFWGAVIGDRSAEGLFGGING
jgi:hypothetical protein